MLLPLCHHRVSFSGHRASNVASCVCVQSVSGEQLFSSPRINGLWAHVLGSGPRAKKRSCLRASLIDLGSLPGVCERHLSIHWRWLAHADGWDAGCHSRKQEKVIVFRGRSVALYRLQRWHSEEITHLHFTFPIKKTPSAPRVWYDMPYSPQITFMLCDGQWRNVDFCRSE